MSSVFDAPPIPDGNVSVEGCERGSEEIPRFEVEAMDVHAIGERASEWRRGEVR